MTKHESSDITIKVPSSTWRKMVPFVPWLIGALGTGGAALGTAQYLAQRTTAHNTGESMEALQDINLRLSGTSQIVSQHGERIDGLEAETRQVIHRSEYERDQARIEKTLDKMDKKLDTLLEQRATRNDRNR